MIESDRADDLADQCDDRHNFQNENSSMTANRQRTFELTPQEDVLIVRSGHFWSTDEIERHFEDVERTLNKMRARYMSAEYLSI